MRIAAAALLASALMSSGCASTVTPVRGPLVASIPAPVTCPAWPDGTPGKADKDAQSSDRTVPATTSYGDVSQLERLRWLVCALHAKANANLNQAQRFENRTEWRDIPLLGAAATVAGLLLFGQRDKTTNALTSGTQDTISGIAFGSAAFATFANYLSPQKARDLLRQGARGHFCLATQGDLILSVYASLDRKTERDALEEEVTNLSKALNGNPSQPSNTQDRAILDAAIAALSTYDLQVRERDTAAIALEQSAWNFGIDLLTRADRDEQKVDTLVKAITDQTESVTKFAATQRKATDPVPPAVVAALTNKSAGDTLALDVARHTAHLLEGLVNVEALVLGFDKCTATALTGATPKADRLQRVTLQ